MQIQKVCSCEIVFSFQFTVFTSLIIINYTMLNKYPIVARKISYKVGFKTIIENISLVLKKTEFIGLIGGSGSGKTTLMTCLNGYRQASKGKITLNGIPSTEKEKIQHLIGYVPQEDIVHKALTIERAFYYSYLLRIKEEKDDKIINEKIDEVLNLLDLKEHKNTKIASLSGGQRKRVNIGMELLHSPELFFLDEPTAGLDPSLERQLMRLLSDLANDNRLIMVTTHLMQNVDLFDIIIFIHKGYMIYFGPRDFIKDYFQVSDMIELFDKVMPHPPLPLMQKYLQSNLYNEFLLKRLNKCNHV
ncbi:hypothetical protein BVX93_01220 [bacterium B13(2017)]|nr:hypothetical protein BVX93_01220 [bacterium B13(2017)]